MNHDQTVAFWSYTHTDNAQDQDRLTHLAEQISNEYSLITGNDLEIFVDRSGISWGEAWRTRIGEALAGTTFFIPVITPRYFKSDECRRELLAFHAAARNLGDYSFIMPILYINVPGLNEDSDDEAIAIVASMQYENWTSLRLLDESTGDYRTAINTLATRLADLIDKAAEAPEALPADDDDDDDAPGVVDLLAEFEPRIETWVSTMNQLPPVLQTVNEITDRGTADIQTGEKQNKPFAHRIVVMRRMASELDEPAGQIESLGQDYGAQAMALDPSMRTLLELVANPDLDDEDKTHVDALLTNLHEMVEYSRTNAESLKFLSSSINQASKLSRDMRSPLRRIDTGLRGLLDAQGIIEEWARLANLPEPDDDPMSSRQ